MASAHYGGMSTGFHPCGAAALPGRGGVAIRGALPALKIPPQPSAHSGLPKFGEQLLQSARQQQSSRGGDSATGNTVGQEAFAAAAQWLTSAARDGVRSAPADQRRATSLSARESQTLGSFGTPLTARSGRRWSGDSNMSAAATRQEERLMRAVCEQIQQKASQKYRTVREAFRHVDCDHDGFIDKSEMRYFFRAYDFTADIADRFFDHLCSPGQKEIEYGQFIRFMSRYVNPDRVTNTPSKFEMHDGVGGSDASTSAGTPSEPTHNEFTDERSDAIEAEFKDVLEFIGQKASEKFSNFRKAFRYVDGNHDGSIDKNEMRFFFRAFNLPEARADLFFERLDMNGNGEVDYSIFLKYIGPYLQPGNINAAHKVDQVKRNSRQSTTTSSSWTSSKDVAAELTTLSALTRVPYVPHFDAPGADSEESHRELRRVMQRMGEKLPLKFRHVRDAFRGLDLNRNGRISRVEMRSFFRGFGESEDVADQVFELCRDGGDDPARGEVSFAVFMKHFDDLIGPAFRQARRAPLIDCDPRIEKEVNELAAAMGERLTTKYRNVREAFRSVDLNKDGNVCRKEMRVFFRNFGISPDAADRFFDALDDDKSGEISYDEFIALFGASGPKKVATRTPALRKLG